MAHLSVSRLAGRTVAHTALVVALVVSGSPAFSADHPNPHTMNLSNLAQTDGCAACHRMHSEKQQLFVPLNSESRSVGCLTCHDGSGADDDVKGQFDTVAAASKTNNAATRSFFIHDAVAISTGHVAPTPDADGGVVVPEEFAGVSNRHADCVDCHNPHAADPTIESVASTTGWTASGAIAGASVVRATWSGSMSFSFIDRASTSTSFQYQLCLKCHSSYTDISNAGFTDTPSKMWIDKGLDVNPNNDSMHPISAQGTNQTSAMATSLAGGLQVGSGAGQWNIGSTSTISCTACHGSSASAGDTHASTHRGILRWNYQDRVLNASSSTYAATDFTLCWQCHAQDPFTLTKAGAAWSSSDETTGATNFSYLHTYHISQIGGVNDNPGPGVGTNIDTAGDGNGNAICAECHFRLHSTAQVVAGQNLNGGSKTRLVNFAPNVVSIDGGTTPVTWVMKNGATPGSCTLTCHGYTHSDLQY